MHRWYDRWMNRWMEPSIDWAMDRWVDRWIHRSNDRSIHQWLDRYTVTRIFNLFKNVFHQARLPKVGAKYTELLVVWDCIQKTIQSLSNELDQHSCQDEPPSKWARASSSLGPYGGTSLLVVGVVVGVSTRGGGVGYNSRDEG